jgi:hypothetical protein
LRLRQQLLRLNFIAFPATQKPSQLVGWVFFSGYPLQGATMSELNDLEQAYLAKDGVPPDNSLPPDFPDHLPALRSDPTARAADRQARLANVRRLLDQLDSADNQVVKMQKRRVIRAELNAIKQLESIDD